jgi:secondary thiamine-phosphate synthase enzyme
METLAETRTRCHARFRIVTEHPTQFIDLTDRVQALVAELAIATGIVNVQSLHTTTAIVLNEHEPLLLADFSNVLERVAPSCGDYRHDDLDARTVNVGPGERINGHAHCRALVLSPSVCLNVAGGRLLLGRWQRIFLAELDGPQVREVSVLLLGEAGR